ncbi:hypothetical protein R6Z07M_000756 [Ovis aries]
MMLHLTGISLRSFKIIHGINNSFSQSLACSSNSINESQGLRPEKKPKDVLWVRVPSSQITSDESPCYLVKSAFILDLRAAIVKEISERDVTDGSGRFSDHGCTWGACYEIEVCSSVSSEKTLMLGKIEGKCRSGQQRMRWLDSITNSECGFEQTLGHGEGQGSLIFDHSPWGQKELDTP